MHLCILPVFTPSSSPPSSVPSHTALHCLTLHRIVLHCTALSYTALHCLTLHRTPLNRREISPSARGSSAYVHRTVRTMSPPTACPHRLTCSGSWNLHSSPQGPAPTTRCQAAGGTCTVLTRSDDYFSSLFSPLLAPIV